MSCDPLVVLGHSHTVKYLIVAPLTCGKRQEHQMDGTRDKFSSSVKAVTKGQMIWLVTI